MATPRAAVILARILGASSTSISPVTLRRGGTTPLGAGRALGLPGRAADSDDGRGDLDDRLADGLDIDGLHARCDEGGVILLPPVEEE